MKELMDALLKVLPLPLVIATVATGVAYFAVYYHYSYHSYGDAFRDQRFRTAAIACFAIAFVYIVNYSDGAVARAPDARPLALVPQFMNDIDNNYRNPLVADLAARLDKSVGRSGTVERLRTFVADEKSAREIMKDYRASAILYDASVSTFEGRHLICVKLLTDSNVPVLCLPPFSFDDRDAHVNNIVLAIIGHLAGAEDAETNPLIRRLRDVEDRLNQLTALVQADQSYRQKDTALPVYAKRYAVIVGVDKNLDIAVELRFSKSDAKQLADVLRNRFGFVSILLLDQAATKVAVLDAIQEVANKSSEEDMFVFYFVGHGTEVPYAQSPTGRIASLVPYDFARVREFTAKELLNAIAQVPAKHKVAIVDACHATSGLSSLPKPASDEETAKPILHFLGACKADQYTHEGGNGGAFSQAFIMTLLEAADRRPHGMWMREVFARVQSRMGDLQYPQIPELLTIEGGGEAAWTPQALQTEK